MSTYEEMRATNDNDNELKMWENVSCPDPRECLVICMPILMKRRNIVFMPSVSAEIRIWLTSEYEPQMSHTAFRLFGFKRTYKPCLVIILSLTFSYTHLINLRFI